MTAIFVKGSARKTLRLAKINKCPSQSDAMMAIVVDGFALNKIGRTLSACFLTSFV